mgnify:CR=1 FL=1
MGHCMHIIWMGWKSMISRFMIIWRYQSGMNAENAEDAVIRKVMVPPLEAAGEEPGLIGQWISTELKNQSGQNITYGMYFGDYQYFEFQYGQMGHDLECWSGTFEVTDQFRNGELVVHYVLYTPDGIREGEFYTMVNYGEMLVTEGSGDAIFPFTDASTEWFYSY